MTKILHIVNSYLPQSEIWLYHQLKSSSLDTHIFSCSNENNFSNDRIKVHSSKRGKYLNKSWKKKSWLIGKFWKMFAYFYRSQNSCLVQILNHLQPDIVHVHFGNIAVQFFNELSNLQCPVYVSFYGYDYEFLPRHNPLIQDGYLKLFRLPFTFVCEGDYSKKVLIEKGCPSNQVIKNHLGIPLKKIEFRKPSKIKNQIRLIQVASFTEKKGYEFTLDSISQALNECPNIQCTLVGNDRDGKTKEIIRKKIIDLELSSHVKIIDFISYQDLHELLSNYDVFIHPSCHASDGDCEGGAPIILLDAQAVGLPVISTYHCDIPEEVIHNRSGILCEEKNVQQLSDAISIFYKMDNFTISEFARYGRRHVENNYESYKCSTLLDNHYRKALI